MVSNKDTLTIAWCDGGMTDGKFTQGLVYTILDAQAAGINIKNFGRCAGNQIGRQRQVVFDGWADNFQTDWLLWVDSDVVLTLDILKKLWEAKNKVIRPVVSGIYFISKSPEGELSAPMAQVFNDVDEFTIQHIHPLPENEVIKVDCAGMGLVLMHKSIVPKLREAYPQQSMFAEQEGLEGRYVSEDIVFFRKLKAVGVPVYAHTGAIAQHMKRFNFDYNYYAMWWNSQTPPPEK